MSSIKKLQDYCDFGFFYTPITDIQQLSASGSNRIYYRLFTNDTSYIGVKGTSREENKAFIYMSDYFYKKGLNVPRIFEVSEDGMSYIQEDLGDVLLFDRLSSARQNGAYDNTEKQLLYQVMRNLAFLQTSVTQEFDYNICYPQSEFNERSIRWDLNYFKYCFLKPSGVDFQEDKLEDDFQKVVDKLTKIKEIGFMYRDFQSRNIIILNSKPYYIDYQGGRRGPLHYDVASFLWQAKANYPQELRDELIEIYLDELQKYRDIDREQFKQDLMQFVLFRTLQVLGAYGYRGWFERKPHFLQSIPFAIQNLKQLLLNNSYDYEYLVDILNQITNKYQPTSQEENKELIVYIYSFSYKKGIPEDNSGNGGGYVFDCRAIHNPGKYDEFKKLTGLDLPVQQFLEKDGEILQFLQNAYNLVDASVERYMKRGFTSLYVCFGCTGGQHRSAYSAEKMAKHIAEKYKVKVQLTHRELNIHKTL